MRKVFLSALLFAGVFFAATAQENSKWLGGTISLSGQSNGQTQTSTTIMPEFGINTGGPWAFGGRVGFSTDKTVTGGDTRRVNTTSLVPFARYTFGEVAGFSVFGQGELPLNFYGGKHYDGSSMEGSTSIGFRVRPGINYSFTERFGFNMYMPSLLSFVNNSSGGSTYRIGVNDGYTIQNYLLNTSIGFIYMF